MLIDPFLTTETGVQHRQLMFMQLLLVSTRLLTFQLPQQGFSISGNFATHYSYQQSGYNARVVTRQEVLTSHKVASIDDVDLIAETETCTWRSRLSEQCDRSRGVAVGSLLLRY